MAELTRGERNNNPGNIRGSSEGGIHWFGERARDDDPAFEQFETPEYGIRALARTLLAYYERHGLRTIRKIISRWAPGNENDTGAYVKSVCDYTGKGADDELDLADDETMKRLVMAIIRQENGRIIYPDYVVETGIDLSRHNIS